MSIAIGRGWIAVAIRLPAWLAARAPAPVACTGAGITRHARQRARSAAEELARGML